VYAGRFLHSIFFSVKWGKKGRKREERGKKEGRRGRKEARRGMRGVCGRMGV